MRMLALLGAGLLAASITLPANAPACDHHHRNCPHDDLFRGEDVEVSIDDNCIRFTDEETGETVLITEEYELIINDRIVHLDRHRQRLVEKYYNRFSNVTEDAIELAKDAVKIGLDGAKIGASAVLGVLKVLSSDYDSDDLKADLAIKGDKIERKAERLEQRGAKLEERAQSLEGLHRELRSEIRELDELEWF